MNQACALYHNVITFSPVLNSVDADGLSVGLPGVKAKITIGTSLFAKKD